MDTIRQIEKTVKEKRKQGYEGYTDTLEYFREFDLKQLSYIEMNEKLEIAADERYKGVGGIITLGTSMLALIFNSLPEQLKNDIELFNQVGPVLVAASVIFVILYTFFEGYLMNDIEKKERVLEIVQATRQERKKKEYKVEVELAEGTKETYSVAVEKR